jgi:hypothetical protein
VIPVACRHTPLPATRPVAEDVCFRDELARSLSVCKRPRSSRNWDPNERQVWGNDSGEPTTTKRSVAEWQLSAIADMVIVSPCMLSFLVVRLFASGGECDPSDLRQCRGGVDFQQLGFGSGVGRFQNRI